MTTSKKICLVTRDFIGPIRNGGIGTAFTQLAQILAGEGHDVTVLYTLGSHSEVELIGHWVSHYDALGITFIPLEFPDKTSPISSHAMRSSYCVYLWLKERAFDMVHFHEWCGIGYYSLLAKYEGLAFADTLMCVQLHSPTVWHMIHNASLVTSFDIIELDYMERRSVELASLLISPSQYLVDWCKTHGWTLPTHVEVIQNLLPQELYEQKTEPRTVASFNEVVFFGRLEWRKGLGLFIKALSIMDKELRDKVSVTFLGKESTIDLLGSSDYIKKAMSELPGFSWDIKNTLDSAEAAEYLKGVGRLAVIASLAENSPYTVLECLAHNIPFLASDAGGTAELIAKKDREAVCFTLQPATLAQKLEQALKRGITTASPAIKLTLTRKLWQALHQQNIPKSKKVGSEEKPLVSVCITHFNRPDMLKRTLRGVAAQDYPNFEVIVVDDGSTSPEAIHYLDSLETEFASNGWKLLRQPNRYLGAARNLAAGAAKGEYLLFMDDDNFAPSYEISKFISVALRTQADILTCAIEYFEDDEDLSEGKERKIQIPLGASLGGGMYENVFGDANALIRRSVFDDVGGYTEDYGVGLEDFEFFSRAVIRGHRLEVIPDPMFCYRKNNDGMLNNTSRKQNALRAIRSYIQEYPQLASGILLAQGYHHEVPEIYRGYQQVEQAYIDAMRARDELQRAHDELNHIRERLLRQNEQFATLVNRAGKDLTDLLTKLGEFGIFRVILHFTGFVLMRLLRLASWAKRQILAWKADYLD